MIYAYVWKTTMIDGWTTAYWDNVRRKYDITHVFAPTEAFQWLKRNAPGYRLLEVQDFLKITERECK